jgi:hypothetical protein
VEAIGPVVEQVERFTLQVGSFADEGNAQRLAEQLRKSFENVHVTTMETQTQKYHRVRVGQYETREEALGTAEKLSQMGFKVLVTSRKINSEWDCGIRKSNLRRIKQMNSLYTLHRKLYIINNNE